MGHFVAKLIDYLDEFLILFYRFTGVPIVDYVIGTLILAFLCVIVGEVTLSLALKANRRYLDQLGDEMKKKEQLSLQALQAGDKPGYKALNKEATDAWGKRFFTMIAYSAGILWPIPFAMGWMETRFGEVAFPLSFPLSLLLEHVGYPFSFIPIYILCRILFKYMRPHLPYFRSVQVMLDGYGAKETSQDPT